MKKRIFKNLLVLLFTVPILFGASLLYAQKQQFDAVPQDVTGEGTVYLGGLAETARGKNPDILEAKSKWLAAQKKVPQSLSLPDPMIGMDIMGADEETRVGPQMQSFMASQKIPFPLKLWEKSRVENEAARAAAQRYAAIDRDVMLKLKRAYFDLYQVDASIQVIEEVHSLLKKFESVAQARYARLGGTQRDVAKAQAEVSLTLEELLMLKQKRISLTAFINSLLNRDPLMEIGKTVKPELADLNYSSVELLDIALKNRQEILEMDAIVEKRRHEKNLAGLQNIPDLTVGFNYTWVGSGTTDLPDDGMDSWMFPLRVNVPIWQNRIIPSIQEAKLKYQASKAKLLAVQNEAYYEVIDAYERFKTSSQVALLYETAVIPQAKLALDSDQAGYEAGKTEFLELLDSERVFLNAGLAYIRVYAEALKSYADLERATGIDFNVPRSLEKKS